MSDTDGAATDGLTDLGDGGAGAAEGGGRREGRRARGEGGGRAARQAKRAGAAGKAPAYISRKIGYFEVFDEEGLDLIERNADRVLKEVGIEFRGDEETLQIWRDAGADVRGERVHFEPGMLKQIIQQSAPSCITQHARNPERTVKMGDGHTVLVPAYGPPFVRCLDKGRRYATIEDFRNFVKLAYMSPGLHHSGGTLCEPVDLPVNKRHLDMVYSHLRYSDKPFMGSVTAPERAQDTVDMAKIAFGEEFVDQNCVVMNLINANSPMVWDDTMLGALKVYARNNQGCVISPFILAGAMSPVTVLGTLTQLYAEALSGMALTQLVRPGAPVIFGTFASSISMQSGAPTFGSPEPSLVLYGAAQLARRLGVPFRSGGGLCGAKISDAQAAYEAANTLQTAALGGVNFMLHTAGWLEGGLVMGYEKFVMDADQAAMIGRLLAGPDMSENGQAMDAIFEVGPGQHYLGCAHTQRNFEDAFYRSPLADNNSFEQWDAEGGLDMTARANAYWKKLLQQYEAPAIDPGVLEALDAFVAERKAAAPDSNV
ncbi:MAG: trimethylamine methyltransferase family protein [Marivibrio sp.]|uniref:trimethylamine methyltransferase family protein n=1 Tax=Marivibrio sp. TaxID=2039719 RepID=UPI0032EAB77C